MEGFLLVQYSWKHKVTLLMRPKTKFCTRTHTHTHTNRHSKAGNIKKYDRLQDVMFRLPLYSSVTVLCSSPFRNKQKFIFLSSGSLKISFIQKRPEMIIYVDIAILNYVYKSSW